MPNIYKKEPKVKTPDLTKDDEFTKYIKKIKKQKKGCFYFWFFFIYI